MKYADHRAICRCPRDWMDLEKKYLTKQNSMPNSSGKRAEPCGMVYSFNPRITSRAVKRIHIYPFTTKLPSSWKTISKCSPYEDVDLFWEETIPPCYQAIIKKITYIICSRVILTVKDGFPIYQVHVST